MTQDDIVILTLFYFLALVTIGAVLERSNFVNKNPPKGIFGPLVGIIVMLAIVSPPFIATLLLGEYPPRRDNLEELQALLSSRSLIVICIWAALILYRFRGTNPLFYGLAEVFFGVTAILVSISSSSPEIVGKLVALSGGIYIIVRGLDNIDEGLPARFRPFWDFVFRQRQHYKR